MNPAFQRYLQVYFFASGVVLNLLAIGGLVYGANWFFERGLSVGVLVDKMATKLPEPLKGNETTHSQMERKLLPSPLSRDYIKGSSGARQFQRPVYDSKGYPIPSKQGAFVFKNSDQVVHVSTSIELLKALEHAAPGTIVQLKPGDYFIKKRTIHIRNAGLPDHPIIVRAQTQGTVHIKLWSLEGFLIDKAYWVFENLNIEGVCEKHTACEHAFHIVGKGYGVLLRNNKIYNFNAPIKANGIVIDNMQEFPDFALLEYNSFFNTSPRDTRNPVTLIDVVGASEWRVRNNLIADFQKEKSNQISYGAFFKGNSTGGVFENNLVVCEMNVPRTKGIRLGLSLGGGGTGEKVCRNGRCDVEHSNGVIRHNIIMNCDADVGIYLNKAANSRIYNNLLVNTVGIDVRFDTSSAWIANNIIAGRVLERNGGKASEENNVMLGSMFGIDAEDLYVDIDQLNATLKDSSGLQKYSIKVSKDIVDFCGNANALKVSVGPINYEVEDSCEKRLIQ